MNKAERINKMSVKIRSALHQKKCPSLEGLSFLIPACVEARDPAISEALIENLAHGAREFVSQSFVTINYYAESGDSEKRFSSQGNFRGAKSGLFGLLNQAIEALPQQHLTMTVGKALLDVALRAIVWEDRDGQLICPENKTLSLGLVGVFASRASASVVTELFAGLINKARNDQFAENDTATRIKALSIMSSMVENLEDGVAVLPDQHLRKLKGMLVLEENKDIHVALKNLSEAIAAKEIVSSPEKPKRNHKKNGRAAHPVLDLAP